MPTLISDDGKPRISTLLPRPLGKRFVYAYHLGIEAVLTFRRFPMSFCQISSRLLRQVGRKHGYTRKTRPSYCLMPFMQGTANTTPGHMLEELCGIVSERSLQSSNVYCWL